METDNPVVGFNLPVRQIKPLIPIPQLGKYVQVVPKNDMGLSPVIILGGIAALYWLFKKEEG